MIVTFLSLPVLSINVSYENSEVSIKSIKGGEGRCQFSLIKNNVAGHVTLLSLNL
jgi:hypothetical protein